MQDLALGMLLAGHLRDCMYACTDIAETTRGISGAGSDMSWCRVRFLTLYLALESPAKRGVPLAVCYLLHAMVLLSVRIVVCLGLGFWWLHACRV